MDETIRTAIICYKRMLGGDGPCLDDDFECDEENHSMSDDNHCAPRRLPMRASKSSHSSYDEHRRRRSEADVDQVYNAIEKHDVKALERRTLHHLGLFSDTLRKRAWALLVGLNGVDTPFSRKETVCENAECRFKSQVILDVERTLGRLSNCKSVSDIEEFQNKLIDLICTVLQRNPNLNYYQGYHDICFTFLLVFGDEDCLRLVEKVTRRSLWEYMTPTMDTTMEILQYIMPLINELRPDVAEHIYRSGVSVVFALSWLITWFSHVVIDPTTTVRMFDAFVCFDRRLPLYTAAAIVAMHSKEILEEKCEMAELFQLLSKLPRRLSVTDAEEALERAHKLLQDHPPGTFNQLWLKWQDKCKRISREMNIAKSDKLAKVPKRSINNSLLLARWWVVTISIGAAATFYYVYKVVRKDPHLIRHFISLLYRDPS